MRCILVSIAMANLVIATPVAEPAHELNERKSVSVSELATFDNLTPLPVPVLDPVPVPYQNLNFSSFNFQEAGTAGIAPGVVPQSAPNYAANGPLAPSRTPMFTIQGTNTTSFDLESFYYGCLVPTEVSNVQVSTNCTFTATGFKASNGAKFGPVSLTFAASNLTNAAMMEATFGITYSGLKEVTLALTSSPIGTALPVLLVDSVKYVAHVK